MESRNKWYNKRILTDNIELKDNNRDTIIKWLIDTNYVEWYVTLFMQKDLNYHIVKDKLQDIWLMILEIKQDVWSDLYEQGKWAITGYIYKLIRQQLISDTSALYYKYDKYCQDNEIKDEIFWDNYYEKE